MWRSKSFSRLLGSILLVSASMCKKNDAVLSLNVISIKTGNVLLNLNFNTNFGVSVDQPFIVAFSIPIDTSTATKSIKLMQGSNGVNIKVSFQTSTSCKIAPVSSLKYNQNYQLNFLSSLK